MSFHPVSTTPYNTQHILHERSGMAPKRDSGAPSQIWKHHNEASHQIQALSDGIMGMHRALNRPTLPPSFGLTFHPFKIYTFPSVFRSTSSYATFDSESFWRTVRVRSGEVMTQYTYTGSVGSGSNVFGTDGVTWVDRQIYPPEGDGTSDILVPPNVAQFYIWVEQSLTASAVTGHNQYYIRTGSNPSASTADNTWATYPANDSAHWMVGWIDSSSSLATRQLYARQLIRTDIMAGGGGVTPNIAEYSASIAYPVDQHVRVFAKDYFSGTTNVSASWGHWRCIHAVPASASRSASVNYSPTWPEPTTTASAANPNGKYWEFYGGLPVQQNVCINGTPVNAYVCMVYKGSISF